MARKKTLTLTEEHIALISNIKFEKFVFDDKEHYSQLKDLVSNLELSKDKNVKELNDTTLNEIYNFEPHSRFGWGCDQWNLFGGTYVLEDIAMILGYFNQALEDSENLASGRRFPIELENKMYDLYEYIIVNLEDIMTLIFTFLSTGITPGTYEYTKSEWIKKK